MLIDQFTMDRIHDVQTEMFSVLLETMNKLNIRYYFVHGSLLGALELEDFIPEDDDIDIAIFREDYNKLLSEGNKLLPSKYFIQSSINDNYPLSFAKMRNNQTTFWQSSIQAYNCNQGIYIDIFPIDFCPQNEWLFNIRMKLLNIRINEKIAGEETLVYKAVKIISKLLYPSLRDSMEKRERILTRMKKSKMVSIVGGKKSERAMPVEWFGDGVQLKFRAQVVYGPTNYQAYLERIYGEGYATHNPARYRINERQQIEVSASIIDFDNSYLEYRENDN